MGSSSAPLLRFFPPPPAPPARPRSLRIQASSLPSSAPRTKRKNHLRRKLLKPYEPSPPPPPQTLQTPLPPPPFEPSAVHVLFLEDTAVFEEASHEAEGVDPFPALAHRWFPGPVMDLSLRFAALLAVQTVAAVWILGGGAVEKRSGGGGRAEEAEGGRGVGEASEFERKVSEIRAMAKEARESEVKDAGEGNGAFADDIGRKKDGGNSNSGRKIGFLGSKAKDRKVPKGFKGSKSMDKLLDVGNGGIRQIARQNPVKETAKLHKRRVPKTTERFPDLMTSTVPPLDDPADVGNMRTSTQATTARRGNGHAPSVSEIEISGNILEDAQSALSFRDGSYNSYMQSKVLNDASTAEAESVQLEPQIEQSFTEENQKSSTIPRIVNGGSEYGSQPKEIVRKPVLDKDGKFDTGIKSWWLKLPYVFAIFLHRGSDRSCPKGLYSLKTNFPEDDGSFPSYTVAFQDRGDATNFCYLLESFFEDLGDFGADVVPLTIQELDEAVNSGEWKVIVVRKGQVQLYAGQPLTEVETALRSFIDCIARDSEQ